jgi:hypothetical protein
MPSDSSIDWTTISSLATGLGTLVLAAATFASVRSSNRTARLTEASHKADLRPLLLPSRLGDAEEKVGFVDRHFLKVLGGRGVAEVTDDVVYLAMSLRNVGSGIAVLHGWHLIPEHQPDGDQVPDVEDFRRLTRDLYIPVSDTGFWQGAFRDPSASEFVEAASAVTARQGMMIDLLYGDHEGGQRMISRFSMRPRDDGGWMIEAGRHWNVDREDPR